MTTATMNPRPALQPALGRPTAERFAAWIQSLAAESGRLGPFAAAAGESIAAPVERLYAAFADPGVRQRWLPDIAPQPTRLRPAQSATFAWAGGAERVDVTFTATGDGEAWVAVEHTRLPSGQAAADATTYWRSRLAALRDLIED